KSKLKRTRPDLDDAFHRESDTKDKLRAVLTCSAQYPGMGSGHADLYKAFCWRFWDLAAAENGRIGVVLPRSAMSAKGSEQFRKSVFPAAREIDLTMLLNRGGWVFGEA